MKGKDLHGRIAGAWDVRGGVCPEGREFPWWVSQKEEQGSGSVLQALETLQNLPSALLRSIERGKYTLPFETSRDVIFLLPFIMIMPATFRNLLLL